MTFSLTRPAARHPTPLLARLFDRPQLLLRLFAFLIMSGTIASVALMLHVPLMSADAEMGEGGYIDIVDGARRITVPGEASVTFRSTAGGQTVRIQAALLPGVAEPRGGGEENGAYWSARDRVAAMAASGPVEIIAGNQRIRSVTRARSFSDLTIGFWLSLVAGAAAALAGLWVWVLRPRAWAPIMFALSGTGLFIGCATTALNVSAGLGLSGAIDQAMLITNYISGLICAGTIVALFARFPAPLLGHAWLWLLGLASIVIGIDVTFDLTPNAVDLAILICVIDSIAIILLIGLQAWHARRDAEARAALMPIAIGTTISVVLYCILSLAGQLNGGKPLVSPDMTAPLLLMLYLGLGIAIIRARLFALGRWALSMLLSACAILLLLLVDAILLATVTHQRDLAFFLSAMIGITVYLPIREWLLRRAERLREGQTRDLLHFASEMALAPTPVLADEAWRAAAHVMFEPLEATSIDYSGDRPAVTDGGSSFYFPSPMANSALRLRYAGGGTRVFLPSDVETADTFTTLVTRLLDARDAYLRGVSEERGRIARDLHDDVSARLLSSLHRPDPAAMHEDVRSAMADIRTIVSGLSGAPQPFKTMLANLRHETQGRLEAAGVALNWPLSTTNDEQWPIDFATSRQIVSVIRECVTNVIRHAAASSVQITVNTIDGCITVEVTDDGCGIDPHARGGNGLSNAARRATSVGGNFVIASDRRYTRACLTVPFSSNSVNV